MPQDILIGHGLAPEAMTGQGGGKNPSSIRAGEKLPYSKVAQSIKAANSAKVPAPDAPDWQTRGVSSAAIATTPTMRNRSHEGGTVPAATARKDKAGVTRAVGRGRMK